MIPVSELSIRISSMLQDYEGRKEELLSSCSKEDKSFIKQNIGIFQEIKKVHTEELERLVAAAEDGILKTFSTDNEANRVFLESFRREAEKGMGRIERWSLKWSLSGKRRYWIFGEKTDSYYATLAEKSGERALKFFQTLDKSSWRAVKPTHVKYDERANGYLLTGKTPPSSLIINLCYIPPGRPALAQPEKIIWISSSEVPKKLREALARGYLSPSKEEMTAITAPPKGAKYQLCINVDGQSLSESELEQISRAKNLEGLPKKLKPASTLILKGMDKQCFSRSNILMAPVNADLRERWDAEWKAIDHIVPTQIYLSSALSTFSPELQDKIIV